MTAPLFFLGICCLLVGIAINEWRQGKPVFWLLVLANLATVVAAVSVGWV